MTFLPEEEIRQKLLVYMIKSLGFPKELLVTEKAVKHLPHLAGQNAKFPDRRVDILSYYKHGRTGELRPLLLIECKAVALSPNAMRQVQGYNYFIKAPFIAIVNQNEVVLTDSSNSQKFSQFLSYKQLIHNISDF